MTRVAGITAVLLALQAFALVLLGQRFVCDCGYVKLWEGNVLGPGNSQHISDWYTFSHVIHGFIFYAVLSFIFPKLSLTTRFLLALGIEIGWEVIENTPWAIDHYRQQALAQGYIGDTVLNSLFDTLAAALGFLIAWRAPILLTAVLALGMEVFVGLLIRDNLTLNVIGFFIQPEFISSWQSGG
jgi:hypothetical protein